MKEYANSIKQNEDNSTNFSGSRQASIIKMDKSVIYSIGSID